MPFITIKNCYAESTTLYPTDDAWIYQGAPETEYGGQTYISVSPCVLYGGVLRRTVVLFDLTSLPSNILVTSAIFSAYYYTDLGDGDPVGLDVNIHRVEENWNEVTVNWNNQPSHNSDIEGQTPMPSGYGWVDWTITDLVQEWSDGDYSNYGFKMRFDAEDSTDANIIRPQFYSSESGTKPKLVIIYTEIKNTVTYYYEANSVLLMNGTKISNGTSFEYENLTVLELQGVINKSYTFMWFDWTSGNASVNPYNYTSYSNDTIWLLINPVTEGDGNGLSSSWVISGFLLFALVFIPLIVIVIRRS